MCVCVCVCVVICFDVVGLLYRSYVIIIYYLLLGEVRWVFFVCVCVWGGCFWEGYIHCLTLTVLPLMSDHSSFKIIFLYSDILPIGSYLLQ